MARSKGTLSLASNIEPSMNAPLDGRTVVNLLSDLTASGSYPYYYEGMIVSCKENHKVYQLIGNDPTVADNWSEVGSGSSGIDNVVEGYYKESDGKFYKESTYTTEIIGETGKIYISVDINKSYRWDGTNFVRLDQESFEDIITTTAPLSPSDGDIIFYAGTVTVDFPNSPAIYKYDGTNSKWDVQTDMEEITALEVDAIWDNVP